MSIEPDQHPFRARVTPYLSSLIKKSEAIRKQFVPDKIKEALQFGTETPFEEGKNNQGIYGLERIYADRAVLTPFFDCSAYCRYCFKKTRTLGGSGDRIMSDQNIRDALDYVRKDERINTILITGGDPFIRPDLVKKIFEEAVTISHVTKIRIGTRNILFQPDRVTDEIADMLASYNFINYQDIHKSKNVSVGLSLNHPDEITPEVVRAVNRLTVRGVTVKGQTVLMKGVNDDPDTILRLANIFLNVGIAPYYLFHCMPVVGAKHFRTSVEKGLKIIETTAQYSGSAAFLYVYVTPVGKHRLSPGQELEYVTINNQRYIRAVSPYYTKNFFEFSGKRTLPLLHETDPSGKIISHYLDGDDD